MDSPPRPPRPSQHLNRQAGPHESAPTSKFGDLLSDEIWVMIFEYAILFKDLSLPLWRERFGAIARLVSKRFNSIATPIAYRTFDLSDQLVARQPDQVALRIGVIVQAYTRMVSIKERLDWGLAVEFLSRCRVLQDLKWSPSPDTDASLPEQIQAALQEDWPHIRLHFERMFDPYRRTAAVNLETIPVQNLSTLDLTECDVRGEAAIPDLNALVAVSKRLETLHLVLTQCRFSAAYGKLPPIERLSLDKHVEWLYESTDEVDETWDFSRLAWLQFNDIHRIVACPPAQSLGSLRVLKIEGTDREASPEEKHSSSLRISNFVRTLENLEDADIKTWYPAEIIRSLSIHGKSLKKLALPMLQSTPSHPLDYLQDQWLGVEDITSLCASCPNLLELRLVLNTPQERHREETFNMDFVLRLLEILATLENLREAVLQYSLYSARGFCNRDFAPLVIEHFNAFKRGTALRHLCVYIESRPLLLQSYLQFFAHGYMDASGRLESYEESIYSDIDDAQRRLASGSVAAD